MGRPSLLRLAVEAGAGSVEIRVGAFPDRSFEGRVVFVAPTVDPDTRTQRRVVDFQCGLR